MEFVAVQQQLPHAIVYLCWNLREVHLSLISRNNWPTDSRLIFCFRLQGVDSLHDYQD